MRAIGLACLAVAGATALGAGCAGRPARAQPPAPEQGVRTMSEWCPMEVPGATVTAEEVEGGAAMAFTTSSGADVTALRERVRSMADMHNQNRADERPMGRGRGGMMPGGMMVPASTASVEDIEGGARLVIRPKDTAQLEVLRDHVRMRAQHMATGVCPRMAS